MIYSCESKKWKRLTGAHRDMQIHHSSAPPAKRSPLTSADLRCLLSLIKLWASYEEKFHLRHLYSTKMHEYKRYLFELVTTTLRLRHGTAWLPGFESPVVIRNKTGRPLLLLARAVLRIRNSQHADSFQYDIDGLLRGLQARAMLGILEHRVRVYLVELQLGVKSVITLGASPISSVGRSRQV